MKKPPRFEGKLIATGDTWLANLVPQLTALPSYQSGSTLIVLTWDEGNGPSKSGSDCTKPSAYSYQPSCQIPTIIISPYIAPGATDRTDHDLYGLLGTMQDILGYPRLNQAVGRTELRTGSGLLNPTRTASTAGSSGGPVGRRAMPHDALS